MAERGLLADVRAPVLHHAERLFRNTNPGDDAGITGREAMKKKTSGGCAKTTVSCMPEPVLRHLVRIAGLQKVTM